MTVTVTLNPALDKTLRVPNFQVGHHVRARLLSLIPAGKGINVARGLSRLRANSVACGLVGRGELETYRQVLECERVDCALSTVQGVTRTNTTILDPECGTTTHLREEGFTVSSGDLQLLREAIGARLQTATEPPRLAFAGSLPPGVRERQFVQLLAASREAGPPVVLDTSGPPLRRAVDSGLVDTIKPNLAELGQCLGREVERSQCLSAARELLDRVKTVLLTLGEGGAYVVRDDVEAGARCVLRPGEVENTVGCGDAFLAGYLDATERNQSPADALRWAVAAGAASARGQTAVDYNREDVRQLLGRCESL